MKNSWRYTSCGARKISDASSISVDLQYPRVIAYMFQSSYGRYFWVVGFILELHCIRSIDKQYMPCILSGTA